MVCRGREPHAVVDGIERTAPDRRARTGGHGTPRDRLRRSGGEQAAGGASRTLSLWIMKGTDPSSDSYLAQLKAAFQERTGATLDVQEVQWKGRAQTKVNNAIAGGTTPDVGRAGHDVRRPVRRGRRPGRRDRPGGRRGARRRPGGQPGGGPGAGRRALRLALVRRGLRVRIQRRPGDRRAGRPRGCSSPPTRRAARSPGSTTPPARRSRRHRGGGRGDRGRGPAPPASGWCSPPSPTSTLPRTTR